MRIPDAYYGGLGRSVEPIPPAPDAVLPDGRGAAAIAEAGGRIGQGLFQLGVDEIEYRGRMELHAANERRQEAERLQREQEAQLKEEKRLADVNAAKRRFMDFETTLGAHEQSIIDDPEIPPEKYPEAIRSKAAELMPKVKEGLSNYQWLHIETGIDDYVKKSSERMFQAGQKEINDQAWADDLAAADALVNNPVKTAREKIVLLKDDNFFADTGRPAHEIEKERQARIEKVAETEVAGLFNDRGPVDAKGYLEAKNPDGTYVNLPEMHQDKREAYIAHADEKIKQLEAEARREARERKTLQDQQTHNLFESVKTMLTDGYQLPPNVDVQARLSFKGTKYEPLYAAVKEKSNSLAFQTELTNKDPLLYYARRNGYNVPPLDLSNPTTLPQQVAARIAFSAAAQKSLNLPYRPDFLAEESKAIGKQLEALDGTSRVQAVKMWSALLGPQNMTQFAKQASGVHSDDPAKNTALALEIGLAANGKDTAAQWVAGGRDYLKTVKIDAKAHKAQNDAFEALAGSSLKNLPQTRDDYRSAVNAAFVYLAKAKGLDVETEKSFSPEGVFSGGSDAWKLYNQAFKSVVGETVKVGNKTTIVPPGLTPDGFKNSIKQITPEIVTAAGGVKGLDPAKAAERLRSDASLWESGEGVYTFQIGGKQLKTNAGKPFKLRFGR